MAGRRRAGLGSNDIEGKLQHLITFYLTGRREGSHLQPLDARCRPALMARFGDLSRLRYDFPLVLNREGSPERAVLPLSRLVDDAVEALAEDPERDRIARHGYRLERELRRDLAAGFTGDFLTLWNAAADRLSGKTDETVTDSAKLLWKAFGVSGEIVDADSVLPARAVRHAWTAVQIGKARKFRQKTERLLLKLRNILEAEEVGSAAGRAPSRLKSSIGLSYADVFDFDAMSRILVGAKPSAELSKERRKRIYGLIDVLERQRFYWLGAGGPEPYAFAFERCTDALKAYQDRRSEAVELVKTLAVAELEAKGEYRESVHDVLFEDYGSNGLDIDKLAELPDYLVFADAQTPDPVETAQIVSTLAAGIPIKVLVQTDDVFDPPVVAEGHVALGTRARQLVQTAIGLTDVFVLQSSASNLFGKEGFVHKGLTYEGPTLFSVFSGANDHTGNIPAYLVSAAASESRVFPSLAYDPSAGSDWATRLSVGQNPARGDDWPVYAFNYEDEKLQARSEDLAFTVADFMAMDDRFFTHFALVPDSDWSDAMVPVHEALETEIRELPEKVPSITLVDDEGRMQRAILDDRTLVEARRCRTMWHSLQELGGIHNSHAERLLAQERRAREAEIAAKAVETGAAGSEMPVPEPVAEKNGGEVTKPAVPVEVAAAEPAAEERNGDEPYIETPRCTTCNECTEINGKMFAYDENKQAYIVDPEAGTFRQMVEAAESCQVSIIHPGKPRNPKEPGLEDLIRRAAEFN